MTHWKKLTNPNYLGAYSIEDGKDLILTIGTVAEETVIGADGKREDCPVCHFEERGVKPMILNSTNMKMITKLLGTPYIENWRGHKIQIGAKKVKAFGEIVERCVCVNFCRQPTTPNAPGAEKRLPRRLAWALNSWRPTPKRNMAKNFAVIARQH